MPNKEVHAPVGGALGLLAVASIPKKWDGPYVIEAMGGVLGGIIGSKLPDVVDLATSPRHRGKAHSLLSLGAGKVVVAGVLCRIASGIEETCTLIEQYNTYGNEIPQELVARMVFLRASYGFVLGVGFGWLSHLVLDACTPDGLRLLNSVL